MDHIELGLTLSMNHGRCLSSESITSENYYNSAKKRRSDEAFDDLNHVQFTTLSLFGISWKNDEEDDDEYKELDKNSSTTNNDGDGDDEGVVGWPPVNVWRKKVRHGILNREYNVCRSDRGRGDGSLIEKIKSTYIKVTMEGVGIGRKVDLSLHHSYHTLASFLFVMFGKVGIDEENVKNYEVTYQDMDGDWLLTGDVPWSTFIRTARRLKLVRSRV